jgi:hypothetical protein
MKNFSVCFNGEQTTKLTPIPPPIPPNEVIEIREDLKIVNSTILLPLLRWNLDLEVVFLVFRMLFLKRLRVYSVYRLEKFIGYHIVANDDKHLWLHSRLNHFEFIV